MKKLTVIQWIILGIGVLSMLLDSGIFGEVINGVLLKVISALSVIKFAYDQYRSFSAQNMVDFANSNLGYKKASSEKNNNDLKYWIDNQ